ncbi:MAG: UvrD-helicase domain-containing protein [Deltaproteobacteria bacterium]|nr:UvrD-helicase domain-containing protein [Deltaproteobacteria bacterium]
MDAATLAGLLNPPQLAAVLHVDGPLLVFAGAGSGKTRVITHRIAHLLDLGVAPWRVLAVTFTNKAAGEMRERVARLVGDGPARELWLSTFHALGARLLRRYADKAGLRKDFAIYDDADQRAVMNRVYDDLKIDDKHHPVRGTLTAIDRAKQEAQTAAMAQDAARSVDELLVARAWQEYERRLQVNNAVDFGDLIARTTRLLEADLAVRTELQERFVHVLVDEFQDTNGAQYRTLRALTGLRRNLCVVGDDDQAIYRWRGADVRNIRYFRRDHPDARVLKLEENYRSTQRILRAANAVIGHATEREGKVLFTKNPEGSALDLVVGEDERDEARRLAERIKGSLARGTAPGEVALFYRIHAQSRPLEEALRAAGVAYVVLGGMRFYERAEVKDLLAYLRLLLNPTDDVSLLRVVNTPPRKLGKTTLERLQAHGTARGSSLWKLLASGDYPSDVGPAARKNLQEFYKLLSRLRNEARAAPEAPWELARRAYEDTGYRAMLEAHDDPENEARRENLAELLGSIKDWQESTPEPSLGAYLESVTLDAGAAEGQRGECVSMMTVHSAKGLEFDEVFLVALEEGMFPYKGIDLGADREELEEERRLAYVAITRARKHLTVSFARFRQIFGQTRVGVPSRFLEELPADLLSSPLPRGGLRAQASAGAYAGARSPGPWSRHGPARDAGTRAARAVAGAPPETLVDDGPRLVRDEDLAPPPTGSVRYRKGMRVRHAKFGAGRVQAVEPGPELKVVVYFPSLGAEKRLLAEYLQPL